jgi:hypothetical protein
MKMSKPLYNEIEQKFSEIKKDKQENINWYHKMHQPNKRIVWDIFWLANSITHGQLHDKVRAENLNDSHLYTALLKAGKELNIID